MLLKGGTRSNASRLILPNANTYQEAQNGIIMLDDDPPDGVQVLLEYLYTLEEPLISTLGEAEHAYLLGDKYGLPILRDAGKKSLIGMWGLTAAVFEWLPDYIKMDYLESIQELWSWTLDDVKEIQDVALAGLCSSARSGALLHHQGFRNLLWQNKGFCIELMTALAQRP